MNWSNRGKVGRDSVPMVASLGKSKEVTFQVLHCLVEHLYAIYVHRPSFRKLYPYTRINGRKVVLMQRLEQFPFFRGVNRQYCILRALSLGQQGLLIVAH